MSPVNDAESIGCTARSLCDQGDYAAAQPLAERCYQLARSLTFARVNFLKGLTVLRAR